MYINILQCHGDQPAVQGGDSDHHKRSDEGGPEHHQSLCGQDTGMSIWPI